MADIAGEKGMDIGVEPLPKDEIGSSLDEVFAVIERIDRPNVGINFDVNHLYPPEEIPSLIGRAGPLMMSVHICDQDRQDGTGPVEGTLDWREVIAALVDSQLYGTAGVRDSRPRRRSPAGRTCAKIAANYERLIGKATSSIYGP